MCKKFHMNIFHISKAPTLSGSRLFHVEHFCEAGRKILVFGINCFT